MKNEELKEIIELMRRNGISEFELERDGIKLRIKREENHGPAVTVVPSVETPQEPETEVPKEEKAEEGLIEIKSPIVGTFYRSPGPESDPFVNEGDYVKKGTVLCIVEAMKVMNEIESHAVGQIAKVHAQNARPVEYGEVLFSIRPTD